MSYYDICSKTIENLTTPLTKSFPDLEKDWIKIRGVLKGFAFSRGYTALDKWDVLDKLILQEICDRNGNLTANLEDFIDAVQLNLVYNKQTKTRIQRILNRVIQSATKDFCGNIIPETAVPDFMLSILPYLPTKLDLANPVGDVEEIRFCVERLTDRSKLFWRSLVRVVQTHHIISLESLFVTESTLVHEAIRTCCPPEFRMTICSLYCHLRKRLGFNKPRPKRESYALAEFPGKLREQCELFKIKAAQGVAADYDLMELAAEAEVRVHLGPLQRRTIEIYLEPIRKTIIKQ